MEGKALANALGVPAIFVRTDVTQEEDLKGMIDRAVRTFGRVDRLFNDAGGSWAMPQGSSRLIAPCLKPRSAFWSQAWSSP